MLFWSAHISLCIIHLTKNNILSNNIILILLVQYLHFCICCYLFTIKKVFWKWYSIRRVLRFLTCKYYIQFRFWHIYFFITIQILLCTFKKIVIRLYKIHQSAYYYIQCTCWLALNQDNTSFISSSVTSLSSGWIALAAFLFHG